MKRVFNKCSPWPCWEEKQACDLGGGSENEDNLFPLSGRRWSNWVSIRAGCYQVSNMYREALHCEECKDNWQLHSKFLCHVELSITFVLHNDCHPLGLSFKVDTLTLWMPHLWQHRQLQKHIRFHKSPELCGKKKKYSVKFMLYFILYIFIRTNDILVKLQLGISNWILINTNRND